VNAADRTIAVDWGTSRVRATWLLADGSIDGFVRVPTTKRTLVDRRSCTLDYFHAALWSARLG
jgi:2-keto-3-deoxy-galactonokinase